MYGANTWHPVHLLFFLVCACVPELKLQCFELPFSTPITIDCFSPSGPIDFATCSFDGGPTAPCE